MTLLSNEELVAARLRIVSLPAGLYELSQIYGASWASIASPTSFGARFKSSVAAGHLVNIELASRKTNNHQTYCIHK